MLATRQSYCTGIIILFRLGLLPYDILRPIPYSTRYNWKRRDTSKIVGADDPRLSPANTEMMRELIAHNHLYPLVRALLRINRVLLHTLRRVRRHKKLLAERSEKIVRITERFTPAISAAFPLNRGRDRILKWFGVSVQQFHYWKRNVKRCPSSLLDLCRTKHPLQLSTAEIRTIRKYATDPAFAPWSFVSIYLQILRDGAAFFALSTFYKTLRRLGISKKFHSYKIRKEGIRASKPGEIIHADITEFRLSDQRKVYIYHFADNFSRFPFRCMASFDRRPEITLQNLEAVLEEYPHLFHERFTLLVDDGVENKGALADFASRNREFISLLIAMKDIMISNSMIEARNRSLKIEYLKDREFSSLESLQKFLDTEYLENFRNRPLQALTGFTPIEVLKGALPNAYRFRDQIAEAKHARVAENRAFNCNSCSEDAILI